MKKLISSILIFFTLSTFAQKAVVVETIYDTIRVKYMTKNPKEGLFITKKVKYRIVDSIPTGYHHICPLCGDTTREHHQYLLSIGSIKWDKNGRLIPGYNSVFFQDSYFKDSL